MGCWERSPEGKGGMAAAVVELNALANAVGPTTQDEDLGIVGGLTLTLPIIGAVHVGCAGLKLSGAGVHALHGGHHALQVPHSPHLHRL